MEPCVFVYINKTSVAEKGVRSAVLASDYALWLHFLAV